MQRSKRASRNPESSESAWAAWLEVEEASFPVVENGSFNGEWESRGRPEGDAKVTWSEVRAHETVHLADMVGRVVVLLCLCNTGRSVACLSTSEGVGIGKHSLFLLWCEARNARYLDAAVRRIVENRDSYMDTKRFEKQIPCRRLDVLSLPFRRPPNFPPVSPSALRLERGCEMTVHKRLDGVWAVKVYRPSEQITSP